MSFHAVYQHAMNCGDALASAARAHVNLASEYKDGGPASVEKDARLAAHHEVVASCLTQAADSHMQLLRALESSVRGSSDYAGGIHDEAVPPILQGAMVPTLARGVLPDKGSGKVTLVPRHGQRMGEAPTLDEQLSEMFRTDE
jgi:hypothetical protein